jgi:hypothetical protein
MTIENGSKICTIHGAIRAAIARSDPDGVELQYEVWSFLRERSAHAKQCQRKPLQRTITTAAFSGVFHQFLQPSNLLSWLRTPFILEPCHSNFLATMEANHQGGSIELSNSLPSLFSLRRGFPMVPVDHVYHNPHSSCLPPNFCNNTFKLMLKCFDWPFSDQPLSWHGYKKKRIATITSNPLVWSWHHHDGTGGNHLGILQNAIDIPLRVFLNQYTIR